MDDGDSAALLVFEFLNEIGFRTGDLEAADFKQVVTPLLAGLNLRVAHPERLAEERELSVQLEHIEGQHLARLRRRLRQLNRASDDEGASW
jgi:hypothetical protein